MADKQHPFEAARLGAAPFVCLGVSERWHEMPGFGRKPGGCCAYCGTGILYAYRIRSADGREFDVGSSCVEKTHAPVAGYAERKREFVSAKREAGWRAAKEERERRWAAEREERARLRQERSVSWRAANPDLVAVLEDEEWRSDALVRDLSSSLREWGSLTDGQTEMLRGIVGRVTRSRHVGQPGERVRGAMVRVARCKFIGVDDRFYPPRRKYLVALETVAGDQLTWWTGHGYQPSDEFEPCDFTVKSHGTWGLVKQTTVLRVKFKEA